MAMLSFLSGNPVSNPNVSFTWRHYNRLVDSDLYFDALVATMRIGAITTIIALLIGYPLAHWMARMHSRVGHALLLMAVIAPLLTGIVVRTFAWMTVLGDRGVINVTLQWLGFDREAAAADVQRVRRRHRPRAHLRAVHGADAGRRDRPHRPRAGGSRARARRQPLAAPSSR